MGINLALTKLLLRKKAEYNYAGHLLTLGRQEIGLSRETLYALTGMPVNGETGPLTQEEFFTHLGFVDVAAMDYSDHDGAAIIHDLNQPAPEALWSRFDFILDGGTLEHCFNVANFMNSMARMVKPGGTILHINPVQGFCNHGFFNFQPTFYFSFYHANGFKAVDCFFLELHTDIRSTFADQQAKCRVIPIEANFNNLNYHSSHPCYIIFKAVKGNSDEQPPVIPIQEFYYRIFKEKAKVGGGLINEQTYLQLRGDVPENSYEQIMSKSYWL